MDPISLILWGLGALAGAGAVAAVVYVVCLTASEVAAWFNARRSTLNDPNMVAMTIVDRLDNGRYRTVQGVFNLTVENWADHRVVESDRLGPEMAEWHRNSRAVVHTI